MQPTYLPYFEGAYLEDSFFLGMTAEGKDLRLKMEFALTSDHAEYALPLPGEARCFRKGGLLIEVPQIVSLEPAAHMNVGSDANQELDFGMIELRRFGSDHWRIDAEWFAFEFKCASLTLTLDEPPTAVS